MELEQYVDIYLKVSQQFFVDMGGGFFFSAVSKTFSDLKSANEFVRFNAGVWEIQQLADNKFGIRKVEVKLIDYPETIIVNKCNKPESELTTEEHTICGIKYITKSCCKEHFFNPIIPEEVSDFRELLFDKAREVKH